jgi:hypothetical protein
MANFELSSAINAGCAPRVNAPENKSYPDWSRARWKSVEWTSRRRWMRPKSGCARHGPIISCCWRDQKLPDVSFCRLRKFSAARSRPRANQVAGGYAIGSNRVALDPACR